VGKPIKFRGRWRIRWTDEAGQRHSAVDDDHKDAARELRLSRFATHVRQPLGDERRRISKLQKILGHKNVTMTCATPIWRQMPSRPTTPASAA
jgi:hypothetical protein